MSYILEVCVDSVESAIAAYEGGADRLEVCSNLIIGGTTPSVSMFKQIKALCDIPIHVLIRPRYGDFLYSESEYKEIIEDIHLFKMLGADGVVTGCLHEDGSVNLDRMKEIREASKGIHLTLHRAFDVCNEPMVALEQAISLEIDTILTSGQCASCIEGKENIKKIIKKAKDKIHILLGGGVNSTMIGTLMDETGAVNFHMSGKKCLESGMIYRNEKVNMGLPGISEFQLWKTSKEEVEKAKELLQMTYKSGRL